VRTCDWSIDIKCVQTKCVYIFVYFTLVGWRPFLRTARGDSGTQMVSGSTVWQFCVCNLLKWNRANLELRVYWNRLFVRNFLCFLFYNAWNWTRHCKTNSLLVLSGHILHLNFVPRTRISVVEGMIFKYQTWKALYQAWKAWYSNIKLGRLYIKRERHDIQKSSLEGFVSSVEGMIFKYQAWNALYQSWKVWYSNIKRGRLCIKRGRHDI